MANAISMAELMAKSSPSIKSFKKGEQVKGKITKLTSGEILVDIGAKTEAVVLEKDKGILNTLLKSLKEGDSVNVSILNSESDQGNPVVSLRRFIDERLWNELERLKNEEVVQEVTVTDLTKGGFLVTSPDGLAGFLPNSQTILNDAPSTFVGKKIKAVILEINRSLHKIIFSQKAATTDADFSKIVSDIRVGEIIDTVVSNTTTFGIFVSVKNTEGFIHLSELSWDRVESADGYYKAGETVQAKVIGIDKEGKRVNLSVKRLFEDPFEKLSSQFKVDSKVSGEVKNVSSLGVIVDLGEVEGLIKKDKVPPSMKYSAGDQVEVTIAEIDVKRHRVILMPVLKEKPMGYR